VAAADVSKHHLRLASGREGDGGGGRRVESPKNGLQGGAPTSGLLFELGGHGGFRAQASGQVGGYSPGTLPFSLWALGTTCGPFPCRSQT